MLLFQIFESRFRSPGVFKDNRIQPIPQGGGDGGFILSGDFERSGEGSLGALQLGLEKCARALGIAGQ